MFKFDPLAKIRKWLTKDKTVTTEGKYFADAKAIKELYDSLQWKTLDTVTGKTEITLPASYNELYVFCNVSSVDNFTFGAIVPNGITSDNFIMNGHWALSSFGSSFGIKITSTKIRLKDCFINGTEYTNSTTFTVYYR